MNRNRIALAAAAFVAVGALGAAAGALADRGMHVDQDHLAVHTLDIVDDNGVPRMTPAGNESDAVIDGVRHPRVAPASGIVIRDQTGQERGGYGYIGGDRNAMILTLDHHANEAFGVSVDPNGEVSMSLFKRNPEMTDADGHKTTVAQNFVPLNFHVTSDGTPQVRLQDHQNHTRLRLTVTEDGYGAIEFLDAKGNVVSTLAPERDQARSKP